MNVSEKWFDENTALLIKYMERVSELEKVLEKYADHKNWKIRNYRYSKNNVYLCAGHGWEDAEKVLKKKENNNG